MNNRMNKNSGRSGWSRKRGSTLVEFALVFPVLIALMIGIMEFGWLVKNTLQMSNAAREGARTASLGATTTTINSRITSRCAGVPVTTILQYTVNNTTYLTLADSGTTNTAPTGSLIRVTLQSSHRPLTGFIPGLKNRRILFTASFSRE